MDVAKVTTIVVTMLSPTLIVGAALNAKRVMRTVRRVTQPRQADPTSLPSHPPIEELAADLRRLLQRYESLKQSSEVAVRARRLRALEAAIGDCGREAAAALGLACSERRAHETLATPELRRLLQSLVDAGLVLTPASGLLRADGYS